MKNIIVESFGGPDELVLVDGPAPLAGVGEVVIAVEAIGVGYVDIMAREGRYLFTEPGFVTGLEVAGTVIGVGRDVGDQWLNRRVFALLTQGGYAQQVAVAKNRLFALPEQVLAVDAVALGINALVAKIGLDRASVKPGERILVRGAGGGIGLMATQFAAQLEGNVTAMTSSPDRAARLRHLGTSHVLDRGLTGESITGEFDVIVDPVAGPLLGDCIGKLAANGRYLLCGSAGGIPQADYGSSILTNYHKSPTLIAFSLNSIGAEALQAEAEALFANAATGAIKAVVDGILPLAVAADAHRRLAAGGVFGKLVLAP